MRIFKIIILVTVLFYVSSAQADQIAANKQPVHDLLQTVQKVKNDELNLIRKETELMLAAQEMITVAFEQDSSFSKNSGIEAPSIVKPQEFALNKLNFQKAFEGSSKSKSHGGGSIVDCGAGTYCQR